MLHALPTRARLLIVGGGISGLAAAHRAFERGVPELLVLEAGPRLGGHVRTEIADGYTLEAGPDSLVTHKPAGVALCRRLGLDADLLPIDSERATQVLHGSRLLHLPEGFALLAPTRWAPLLRSGLFSPRGKARLAAETLLGGRAAPQEESLRSFVVRRFGREAFERVAEPVFGGLFTADADALDAQATLGRFVELEQRHGSVIRGLRRETRRARGGHAPAARV
ncbi:MAG TPA: protoporphyrinogen oxidase, partial [Candidatus Polarisedimenticolaceae bacterium]|nr:protoporphyrinogen oxidase [Candidatus Polarisedimenticolaceae bacterium]